jgi:hypothetical protein
MLTKSLHTVTAAANVARELNDVVKATGRSYGDAEQLANAALTVLGYPGIVEGSTDPTVLRVVAACAKVLS